MGRLSDLLDRAKSLLNAPKPVRDATDAIKHDRFDKGIFDEVMAEAPALRDLTEDLSQKIDYADDMVRDTLMQFWQGDPHLRPQAEMAESHLIHHGVAEDVSVSETLRNARSYTQHDIYGSAMATMGVAEEVRKYAKTRADAMKEAQEEAERAKEEAEEAAQEAADALAGLGGGTPGPGDAEGEDGEPGPAGPLDDDFHGPLSPEQEQGILTLEQALARAEAAAEAAQQAQEQVEQAAQKAKSEMRVPIQSAVEQAKQDLEEEAELFSAWGVSPGDVKSMSFQERQALATSLRSSKINQFMDLVGRFKLMASAQRVRKVEFGRDQVVGTELSGDLSRVVMTELTALAMGDDDLADLLELDFYRRWHEDQLLSRKFEGQEKIGKGAIICCWDESGSMSAGNPSREAWAKAFALALLDTARHQKRDFVGIGFSSAREQIVWRFPKGRGSMEDVLKMVEHFFGGGTNFERPVGMAMDILEQEFNERGRAKGDLIFITDDDCHVTPDFLRSYQERKKKLDFRTFGMAVGVARVGGALDAMSDNVRLVNDFADAEQVRDIFQVV